MKSFRITLFAFISVALFPSCSNDDNTSAPINEEEVITTVEATLTPQAGGDPVILGFRDIDGDGPAAPAVTVSDNLMANTTYNGSLELLNEAASPAEDITAEILDEALDHQFFFSLTNGTGTTAYAAPFDGNAKPVGLNFTLTTGNAASGTFTIVLRHEPDKFAEGVAQGIITNAGGETDVQVSFPVTVE